MELNISIIPKNILKIISIIIKKSNSKKEVILLDDDCLIRTLWQHSAKKIGVDLKVYCNQEELFRDFDQINKETTFYVDNQLGAGVLGTDVAFKVYQNGFRELYLATGSGA